MNMKQRIVMQRAKAQEALGILRGISELFGAEDSGVGIGPDDLDCWKAKVQDFDNWIFAVSPIARPTRIGPLP